MKEGVNFFVVVWFFVIVVVFVMYGDRKKINLILLREPLFVEI